MFQKATPGPISLCLYLVIIYKLSVTAPQSSCLSACHHAQGQDHHCGLTLKIVSHLPIKFFFFFFFSILS